MQRGPSSNRHTALRQEAFPPHGEAALGTAWPCYWETYSPPNSLTAVWVKLQVIFVHGWGRVGLWGGGIARAKSLGLRCGLGQCGERVLVLAEL